MASAMAESFQRYSGSRILSQSYKTALYVECLATEHEDHKVSINRGYTPPSAENREAVLKLSGFPSVDKIIGEPASVRAAEKAARQLRTEETVAALMKQVPLPARFGKDMASKLRALGFENPEQLLFVDPKTLKLSTDDIAVIKKYQRKYLPKRRANKPLSVKPER
jgi:hypothetical protein